MSLFTKKSICRLVKGVVLDLIKDEVVSIILEQLGVIIIDPTGGWLTVLTILLRIFRYYRRRVRH